MSHDVVIARELKRFSSNEVGFFEGPEKLLEIWFDLKSTFTSKGLRIIPQNELEGICEKAQCKILSSCSNEFIDAYLLSESALLISDHRFIMKTCGTTTLLSALQPLMTLVDIYYPGAKIKNVYYSHQRFQEPHLQPQPHSNFDTEVSYLDEIFQDGDSMTFGKGEDTWYLYGVERGKLDVHDQTLEILMRELDPDFMALFSSVAYDSSEDLIRDTGIDKLVEGFIIDAKIFEPCGFSLNAINKEVYYTIHVTPQIECSWVSVETNVELESCVAVIENALAIFRPGKTAISLMANKGASKLNISELLKDRCSCVSFEYSSLSAYDVLYLELHSNCNTTCFNFGKGKYNS